MVILYTNRVTKTFRVKVLQYFPPREARVCDAILYVDRVKNPPETQQARFDNNSSRPRLALPTTKGP